MELGGRNAKIAIAAVLVFLLTGCTAGADAVESTPPPVEATAPTSTPSAVEAASLADFSRGTVIAHGVFSRGQIEIVTNGDSNGFDIKLYGVPEIADGANLELSALPSTSTPEEFKLGFSYFAYGVLQSAENQVFTLPTTGYGGFLTTDPSYMRTAIIWEPSSDNGIAPTVLTLAPLTWELPDMKPSLYVIDNGARPYAEGLPTTDADGTPTTYRVAAGDILGVIAERFGITTADLIWLNPDRANVGEAKTDSVLNLTRSNRGL